MSAKCHSSRLETHELRDVQRENEQLKKLLGEKDLEIAILHGLQKNAPEGLAKGRRETNSEEVPDALVLHIVGVGRSTCYA